MARRLVRQRAEAMLAAQARRLDYILRGTNVGTWEWNVQTGAAVFNERWADIIGYTLEEISPVSIDTWMRFAHPDDSKESDRLLQACFSGESEYYHCECRMRHKNGEWVWVLDRGKVTTWTEDGKPEWMYGTHQVITERKRAEAEREKLQSQLAQSRKMESIGRLAGGVAHDYNNIVMGILNYAELCRGGIDADHPIRQWLDEITNEAQRSANLTQQLLAFARKQTIAPQVVDLNDAVGNMLKMLRRLIGEDVDLAWEPGADLWEVHIDPGQVDQILANLCVNARDAIQGTGRMTIETENVTIAAAYCAEHEGFRPGDFAMLAVSDDGCGMDQETLEHIFEPFYTTKGIGEGTGLGLATVYGIARQNDGFVNVYSEPGKGTTFRIYLARFEGGERRDAAPEDKTETIGGNETILLVEDEKSIRLTVRLFLEKLGYSVLAAEKPEKADALLSNHPGTIDLLITDVIMPGMSGRELAESLTADQPDLRVLYMSGYTANVIVRRGVLEEGVDFLAKPITQDQLARKVREILDRT